MVSPADGHIEFLNLAFGYYQLKISHVGYAVFFLDSIYLRIERSDFNLGDLKITQGKADIKTVIVYAEKPLIENRDGKITYNVGESALSNGSTTAEMLRNMPMISNDPNGKILLKGKEPKILIDDKPVDLNGQQLADLLESLPGGSIERIELMQNPPPQYANEQGGVINIVTKKGKIGLIGRLTLSGGTRGEASAGANVSYRGNKINFITNLNISGGVLNGYSRSLRQNFYADSTNAFTTNSNSDNHNLRPNFRTQLDYDVNKQAQWSFVLQANSNYFDNESNTNYANINQYEKVWKKSVRQNNSDGSNFNINPQLSYRFKGKNPIELLQIIVSASYGANNNNRLFYQQFLQPETNAILFDSTQNQFIDNTAFSTSSRINYTMPTKLKGFVINTGGFINTTANHNILNTYFFDKTNNQESLNRLLSTNINFSQEVYGLRAGFTYDFKQSWKFSTSLQTEQTAFRFKFAAISGANNHYLNWLPSATLRKDFSKKLNASLVYRKSIRRPGIGELNPAVDYNDPYNLRFGNPLLLPSLAHNFDLNFGYSKGKSYFNASLGYNRVEDIINSIRTLQPDGKTFVTYKNIAARNEYEAGIWGGYTFSKKLRMNMSAGYTYNAYSLADRTILRYRNGGTFYTTINYNLMLSNTLTADGNFRYSSFADPQGKSRSNITMNLGVQYKLFDKKFLIAFNIIDPFTTQQLTTTTEGPNFKLESFNSNRTRNYRLSLAWSFSKKQNISAPKNIPTK